MTTPRDPRARETDASLFLPWLTVAGRDLWPPDGALTVAEEAGSMTSHKLLITGLTATTRIASGKSDRKPQSHVFSMPIVKEISRPPEPARFGSTW